MQYRGGCRSSSHLQMEPEEPKRDNTKDKPEEKENREKNSLLWVSLKLCLVIVVNKNCLLCPKKTRLKVGNFNMPVFHHVIGPEVLEKESKISF